MTPHLDVYERPLPQPPRLKEKTRWLGFTPVTWLFGFGPASLLLSVALVFGFAATQAVPPVLGILVSWLMATGFVLFRMMTKHPDGAEAAKAWGTMLGGYWASAAILVPALVFILGAAIWSMNS